MERVIAAAWRLRRLGRVEAGMCSPGSALRSWPRGLSARPALTNNRSRMTSSSTQNIEISDGEKHREALSRAQQMRSEQEAETATLGRTFARDANGR